MKMWKQQWSLPQCQNLHADVRLAAYIQYAIYKCNVYEYRQKYSVGNIKKCNINLIGFIILAELTEPEHDLPEWGHD